MATPSVYCIILSWNGKPLTIDCMRSVLQSDHSNFTLIVVDNHSSDQSAETVRIEFADELKSGKVILIENNTNLGFAGGNNVGIRYAMSKSAEYILLLNNDTVVSPDLISVLAGEMEGQKDIGITGPKIYYFSPPDQIWFAGGEILLHKGISRHTGIRQKDTGQYDQSRVCDYITGCAMMIRRSVIEQCGMLDIIYPLYSEDADFCMRSRKAGYKCLYIPKGKVWHKISAGSGGQLKWKKIRMRFISGLIFYGRYAKWYHWFTIPFFLAFDSLRVLLLIIAGKLKNN